RCGNAAVLRHGRLGQPFCNAGDLYQRWHGVGALHPAQRRWPAVEGGLNARPAQVVKEHGRPRYPQSRRPRSRMPAPGAPDRPSPAADRPLPRRRSSPSRAALPDEGADDRLIEYAPDEDVADARIGELLHPTCPGALCRRLGQERRRGIALLQSQMTVLSDTDTWSSMKTGTRRSGLSSLNVSSPKNGTIGSTWQGMPFISHTVKTLRR